MKRRYRYLTSCVDAHPDEIDALMTLIHESETITRATYLRQRRPDWPIRRNRHHLGGHRIMTPDEARHDRQVCATFARRWRAAVAERLAIEEEAMNKYNYEYITQGDYGHGWEDLGAHETRKDAVAERRVYDENETQYRHRVIFRRALKEDTAS